MGRVPAMCTMTAAEGLLEARSAGMAAGAAGSEAGKAAEAVRFRRGYSRRKTRPNRSQSPEGRFPPMLYPVVPPARGECYYTATVHYTAITTLQP